MWEETLCDSCYYSWVFVGSVLGSGFIIWFISFVLWFVALMEDAFWYNQIGNPYTCEQHSYRCGVYAGLQLVLQLSYWVLGIWVILFTSIMAYRWIRKRTSQDNPTDMHHIV